MPRHGVRLPVKRWGNLIGRMTASLSASLADSSPATSSQRTLGVSDRIAPGNGGSGVSGGGEGGRRGGRERTGEALAQLLRVGIRVVVSLPTR